MNPSPPPPKSAADGSTPLERNATESVLVPVRFPPGWIAAIDEIAALLGQNRNYTIKEAIRRLVKQESGIRLEHRLAHRPPKGARSPAAAGSTPRNRVAAKGGGSKSAAKKTTKKKSPPGGGV